MSIKSERKYQLERTYIWKNNIKIDIETDKGQLRKGLGWENRLIYPYGRFRNVLTVDSDDSPGDGEELDVIIGDYENAKYVYPVMINKYPDFEEEDEWKIFINFYDKIQVKEIFMTMYDDKRFFNRIEKILVSDFIKTIKTYAKNINLEENLITRWEQIIYG